MSESRFAAFDATSAVMPAGIKLLAGFERSIEPMVNWVIFESAPVGVHEVNAMELVQMTDNTRISGSDRNPANQGTPKNALPIHTPRNPKTGTPTYDNQSGSSMSRSGSISWERGARRWRSIRHKPLKRSGRAKSDTSEPTTIMETPHHSAHWLTISALEMATTAPVALV